MIRKTQHKRKMYVKGFDASFKDKRHLEVHLVTTYWFLGYYIPLPTSIFYNL